jgi:hypothetical protein
MPAQVPIGNNAPELVALQDKGRRDAALRHGLGNLLHRVFRTRCQQARTHNRAHLLHHGVGLGLVARSPPQATAALAAEIAIELAIVFPQLTVSGIGQQVTEGILDHRGLHFSTLGVEATDMEALPLSQAIQQLVVTVADLNRATADNAQALLESIAVEDLAAWVILHHDPVHRVVQHIYRQFVERQGLLQKLRYRRQFRRQYTR